MLLRAEMTNHFGPKPKKGGRPPKDKRIRKKIIVWALVKDREIFEIEFMFDVIIMRISMISMKE
ncbi:MAG: hypothetical protein H7835_20420 [Magnetococcus sp. XQGC-1]